MKQTALMHWFVNKSRRPKLVLRKTLLQLLTITNVYKHSPYQIKGTVPVKNPQAGISTYPISGDTHSVITNTDSTADPDFSTSYVLISDEKHIYALAGSPQAPVLVYVCPVGEAPFQVRQPLILYGGDIENFPEGKMATTYGRYLANYIVLATVFNDYFPFQNSIWNTGKVEKGIAEGVIGQHLEPSLCKKYINHAYYLSGFGEIISPSLTRKATTPDPEIIKLRKKLYSELKEQGKETDATALAAMEDTIIRKDKENLQDDPSMAFLGDTGKKFTVHRKRQYGTLGIMEQFDKVKGQYDYVPESTSEGWNIESFVTIANEIRKGSYERGISTAEGGLITKQLVRALQNESITADDCHTTRTLQIKLRASWVHRFYHMNMVIGKQYITLTPENAHLYIDKDVEFRSMMYCEQRPNGYCSVCAGKIFQNLDFTNIGTQPIDMGAALLTLPMKAMHGVKLESIVLNDVDEFVL